MDGQTMAVNSPMAAAKRSFEKWDPTTNEPMKTVASNQNLGEVLPRCSSPCFGDAEAFPEVNVEASSGNESDETPSNKRVFVRGTGKYYETVAEATREANDGDEIVLSSGMYYETEDVTIAKAVSISAANEGELKASVRIVFSAECGAVFESTGIMVQDVAFLQLRAWTKEPKSKDATKFQGCVRVRNSDATFQGCSFSSESAPAIVVAGSSNPTFAKCSVQGCKKVAILCQGRSKPIFEENTIQNNMGFAISVLEESTAIFRSNVISNTVKCAVICGGASAPLFDSNVISDGTQGGFWIQGHSKCVLKNNVIRNNHKAALQISDNSEPHIENNEILDGDGGGIVVHGEAKGVYIGNKLSGSVRAGIGVMDDACPLFIGNSMLSNQGGGAVMAGRSAPIFIGNKLLGNGFVGLGVKEHATPLLQDNDIIGNVGYGVLLQGKSRTEIQTCTIENNRRAGLCACEHAALRATGCKIQASTEAQQRAGLLMHDESKAVMERCTVVGHKTGNVVMQDHSAGSFSDNELVSGAIGLKMHAGAAATLRRNTVRDSKECNVLLLNQAQLRASHNTISGARGAGVRAIQSAVCSLSHNTVADNGDAGVRVEDAGSVELRSNRVSGNGSDGVCISNSRTKLKANVIFGNREVGLALRGAGHPALVGNTVVAGQAEGAHSLDADVGVELGGCSGNAVQASSRAFAAFSSKAALLHSNMLLKSREQCSAAVTRGLDLLDAAQPKTMRVLFEMPDGRTALGEGPTVSRTKKTPTEGKGC